MSFKFTSEHIEFLRNGYAEMSASDLTVAFNAAFKMERSLSSIRAALNNRKIKSGRTGRFEKGQASWNKGVTGYMKANRTSFKKGHVSVNTKPIGHERICTKDGYVLIKVNEKNPYTKAKTRYRHKHIVEWEKLHGPLTKGMIVILVDGDKFNFSPENLVAVTRAQLLYLNNHKFKTLPLELKSNMLALARLETKRFNLQKNQNATSQRATH